MAHDYYRSVLFKNLTIWAGNNIIYIEGIVHFYNLFGMNRWEKYNLFGTN